MKCERCGSPIKKGELYCQKCGAKIKDELNDTINVSILKGNSNDNDDPFYNKNLETNNSLNIFLVILVVVLLIALGLLLLYFYKNNNLATTKEKEEVIKDIYYDEYHLALDNNISILYSNDKLLLKSDNYELSIYTISDKYNDIVRNLDEIKLKWEELGLNIVSSEELKNNLYEVICTYQNHEHIFYIKNMDKTLIIEIVTDNMDTYINNKDKILNIINNIEKNNNKTITNDFVYPEFNLKPIGSQQQY